jgi:outer membrane receptor protein involved in Fe transport
LAPKHFSFVALLALGAAFSLTNTASAESAAADATADSDPAQNAIAAGVWASDGGSKVTYEAAYFESYQSVTAADMLRWLPGGAALLPTSPGQRDNQNDKRGFGSGGDQVLINGKRLSGKSNDIASAMQRIQSNVVSRIEIIRGTTAGLDVRSEGTLFNVVLLEEIAGGSGSWQLHSGFYGTSDPELDGLVSYSNAAGKLDYFLSAQYGPYNRGNQIERFERFFTPGTRTLIERREIEAPVLNSELVLNASGSWSFDTGSVLNVNSRVADLGKDETETTRVFVAGTPGDTVLKNLSAEDSIEWELGGDLEQRVGQGTLKTRAIYTHETGDESERVSLSSTVPGNVPAQSLVHSDETASELIIRSSYSRSLANGQNLEVGIEGAQNTLAKEVRLFEVLANGDLQAIDLFNSDSDVTEDRYEFFSTHFWKPKPDLVLESALNVEYSKIGQEGLDVANARAFTYVKPRFDLRWDLSDATQLRGSLERTVSQLDFGDFVASFDNDNDQVDAGNPDLEPEKAWELKLTYERRLANDNGVVEAQLFHSAIEDHIDNVRVTDSVSASGNIGRAKNYGLELKGSWRLGTLGLEGAVLDAQYKVQDSQTTDPFTGKKRSMSDKQGQEYKINFRHDIAKWRFNYIVTLEWNGKREENDINFRETSKSIGPRTYIGLQYRLSERVLLWFDTRIVFDSHAIRSRDRYAGDVADGMLLRHEMRDEYYRREHIIGLRGQF